ncbi:MAG: hypothetical protein CL424_20200 [Acidimicrobiaceae bacterium]|nr:hypothetical protein [Acidimicrobiaceae bacterium]
MAAEVGPVAKWLPKIIVVVADVVGVALVVLWATGDDPPVWWLIVGSGLLVLFLPLLLIGIRFWTMPAAERERRLGGATAKSRALQGQVDRSKFAHRAAKQSRKVLATGRSAEALVTFLADGGRANEFHSLVYLELEVHPDGAEPYEAQTGEYVTAAAAGTLQPGAVLDVKVDPADQQRVAVDWDASLRLR